MEKNKTTCYTFSDLEVVLSHQEVQTFSEVKKTLHLRFYAVNIHLKTKNRKHFLTFDIRFFVKQQQIMFESFLPHRLSVPLEELTADMDEIIAFLHDIVDQEYVIDYLKNFGTNRTLFKAFSKEEFSIQPTDPYRERLNKLRLPSLFQS